MLEHILWVDMAASPKHVDAVVRDNDGLPRYFRVDTSSFGQPKQNLMSIALRDHVAKTLLVHLTNLGFYIYYNVDNETRLIRRDRIRHHWPAVKSGEISMSNDGVPYIYEPAVNGSTERLVVVFSPINSTPRFKRYFRPSFGSLQKFVPPGTGILRIGDIGGVKGAFYLDTVDIPDNVERISRLISKFVSKFSIVRSKVVLYGASKGGTGSLYYGLSLGYKFVAVDPILSDEWYERELNDYHFTADGVFLQPKQDVFRSLIAHCVRSESAFESRGSVVTSWRSPQFEYLADMLSPLADSLCILDSGNSNIHSHPDVAPNTIYLQVVSLNNSLLGIDIPTGVLEVP